MLCEVKMDTIGLAGQAFLHYRIVEKIGEGGMGAVYKALDTHLDRPVAIKVLPPEKVADPGRKARFALEAKAASALRHPNIVVIHDIASDQGREFIVMELVEGQPLDQLIGRKGLKLSEALGLAVQIADGLAKAHAAGIVHRDLKPTNIMVTADGLVKILDFGLAKLTENLPSSEAGPTITLAAEGKPRTEEGTIVGTAAYMSPEQAEGQAVDARSDIFSFGAVLYEMLTGRKAFGRDSQMKTLAAVLRDEPRPVSEVTEAIPPELERVLNRCLRKDPQRRWQTMSDLKVALQELKEDSESGKLRAAVPADRRGRRRMALLAVPAFFLVVVAAALILKLVLLRAPAAVEYETLPLTFDTGVSASPTVSPDGSLMAFASDREGNGNLDIWVQQISGGKPLRLTDHPADDWYPSFSPDGSQIAFRSDRDGGGIYLIEALAAGGRPRRLADGGLAPRFSPDGRWILFITLPGSLESNQYKAYVVSPKGGEPRRILEGMEFGFIAHGASVVWSPDSKALLFSGRLAGRPGPSDWWVAPIDGGEPVPTHAIRDLGLKGIVRFPVGWIGHDIYGVDGTTIEGVNLFKARIDPKDCRVSGPVSRITTGPGMKIFPTVMPDGRIFFTEMTVSMNAWTVAARPDKAEIVGKPERLTQDSMQNFGPTLSRDGSRAAFSAFGGAQALKFEVRVKDLRTGAESRIPMQGLSVNQLPQMSPDGTLLAYCDTVEGRRQTFLYEPGSGAARSLCDGCAPAGIFPGNGFALVQTGPAKLERADLRTGERKTVLASTRDVIISARLSPDGRNIAWLAGEPDGRAAVRISPVRGPDDGTRDFLTVAEAPYYLGRPDWSPDGRRLYYLSEKNGRCSLYVRELDPGTLAPAGPEREIFSPIESRIWLNFPKGNGEISVGADRIAFEATVMTGNIYVAEPKNR
jgi:serine/threonine protein kinase/Tol biopolymer transport system component